MPSDIHLLPGPKVYIEPDSREDMVRYVRQHHPSALAEGACGTYSFMVGDELVAEAWMHPRKRGWWIRIKKVVDNSR